MTLLFKICSIKDLAQSEETLLALSEEVMTLPQSDYQISKSFLVV
jgi:hypothetical protein